MKKGSVMLYILVGVIFYVVGIATVRYNLFPYAQMLSVKTKIPIGKSNKFANNKHVQLHKLYATKTADIVMLGDSLTSNVNWSELFNLPIINRGVRGDVTEGYLYRMNTIFKLNPKKVFVNGGTNDFLASYSVEDVFENYKTIIKLLQEHQIKPYIQSVVYTRLDNVNGKIKEVNSLLERYCKENKIVYINLNNNLSENGMLLKKYTLDGSHLNAVGYKIWRDTLEAFIKEKNDFI